MGNKEERKWSWEKRDGAETRQGYGGGGQSVRAGRCRKLQGCRGKSRVGLRGSPRSWKGRMLGCGAQDPAKREREAWGRLPRDRRAPLGPAAEISGVQRAVTGPGWGNGVRRTLTNFLDLPPSPPAAGSSSGLRPFFLSRVPRPGPRPPPGGSMSWFVLASDHAPTPLSPGSSKPSDAAQQLLTPPPRPASLACRAARASWIYNGDALLPPACPTSARTYSPYQWGKGEGWRETAETRYLPSGPNHSYPRGGVTSGRCNSAAPTATRPLAVEVALAFPFPCTAHVAVKPGPSQIPDQDIIWTKIHMRDCYLGRKCNAWIIVFMCATFKLKSDSYHLLKTMCQEQSSVQAKC